MATVIYGDQLANKLNLQIKSVVTLLKSQNKRAPRLIVVLVGNNPASLSYIKGKTKACENVGIDSEVIKFPSDVSENDLLDAIEKLNHDDLVDGILVQLPLPNHLDKATVINAIDPNKDVDGFHPLNIGKMYSNQNTFIPCTPLGIIEIIKSVNYSLAGKKAVVIGRSQLVGLPISYLLTKANATVTLCHSKTVDLAKQVQAADVVIAAAGAPELVKGAWIKPGAFVIDVGINRISDGRLIGDIEFDVAKQFAKYITPVPKGVGPLTIHALLSNTVKAYNLKEK